MTQPTRDDAGEAEPPTDYYVVLPTQVIALGPYAVAVYAVLRDFADQRSHECWPSHNTIAERANVSARKVRDVLNLLREHGWITWRQRKSAGDSMTSNVYRVYGVQSQGVRHDVPGVRHDMPNPPTAPHAGGTAPHAGELIPNELVPIEELLPSADALGINDADPFNQFWREYPHKVGKRKAREAYERACRRASPDVIYMGAYRLRTDPNLPDKQFIPYPATWLNRDGWEDEPYPPPSNGNKPPSASRMFANVAVGHLTPLEPA